MVQLYIYSTVCSLIFETCLRMCLDMSSVSFLLSLKRIEELSIYLLGTVDEISTLYRVSIKHPNVKVPLLPVFWLSFPDRTNPQIIQMFLCGVSFFRTHTSVKRGVSFKILNKNVNVDVSEHFCLGSKESLIFVSLLLKSFVDVRWHIFTF